MAQPKRRDNPKWQERRARRERQRRLRRVSAFERKGVFKDVERAGIVDRCQIEPHFGQLRTVASAQEFRGRLQNAVALGAAKGPDRGIETSAFLYFDKDQGGTISKDHVDFRARSTPTTGHQCHASAQIGFFDNVLSGKAREIRYATTVPTGRLHR